MTQSSLRDAWSRLLARESFAFACHVRPDGDCLGAALALARALRGLGKDVTVLSADPVPDHYLFLPDSDTVVHASPRRDFDVGALIDSDVPKRVGDSADAITSAKVLARIDHHLSSEDFGEIQIVDTKISSTSELIYELFEANDIAVDKTAATMLLTGIIFDTGGFRYPNASPRTFEIASRLAALGADSSGIARSVFESRPLKSVKLLGRALNSMQATDDGVIVWATITSADYRELGVEDSDTEGIVNSVGAVKGPKVAMLFREVEPGTVRISLRSREGFDVNQVARAFDGGGHAAAAGCTFEGALDEAIMRVIEEVRRWMGS
jgi:phosphoesterase RecJ-like protein